MNIKVSITNKNSSANESIEEITSVLAYIKYEDGLAVTGLNSAVAA